MQPDRDPNHLYPAFADKVKAVLADVSDWCRVHYTGYTAEIAEGYRSVKRQQELYAQGRTSKGAIVTQRDGVKAPSNHQSALAADICPRHHAYGLTWPSDDHPFWVYLGHAARAQGLKWGGDWHSFKDMPHIEWMETDTATYAAAKAWKKSQGLT